MELSGLVKTELRRRAISILADIVTLPSNEKPEKTGAFVRIFYTSSGLQLDKFGLGKIPDDKFPRYKSLSREKAKRLLAHPHHLSSYQTMDEEAGKWPGAIRTRRKVISTSGLTWKADEALSLQLGLEMGWMDAETAFRIAESSQNELFQELYHLRNDRARARRHA